MEKYIKKRYLTVLLIGLSIGSLFVGVSSLHINDLLALKPDKVQLLLISRLPRLIAIIVAGVGLSVSGLIMQQISRNKFVSPTTAATTDFAKLGVLVSMMWLGSTSQMTRMIVAFIFALGGTLVFMTMMRRIQLKNIIFVPLVGMMLGKVIGSITAYFSYKYDLVQNITSFMEGNLSVIMSGNYEMLYLSIPVVIIGFLYANQFTIVGMGEDFAANLGLNYKAVMNIGLGIVAMITAVTLITVGNIPFLGLIIPNLVTLYMGDHLKNALYHTALIGPIFLLICDILGRLIIYPFEVSIGMMVGVIGGVIFLVMILRRAEYAG
ncbi:MULTISPECIES: ABC transporter permease [Cellulosilyticum]|uniref:ABC-type transporter, integral membrane subunit n=1 Tax=Cellulosilyticum lentocellum (strain ATCC 49066 / DSM 5427 / NCIMB 11756 / RHM5) TaxID=642492 RepID=F2JSQ9_CELLD|nr:iron chelate uptake ABC transporter family permease subunit [Cellulosilyticum lentocellum]ADZ82893.1 ABC-type transporter, integral membrane subunit [Cellulosilyticum lentocellum DSM 5427]